MTTKAPGDRKVKSRSRRRLRGRPGLYTAYDEDMALLNTHAKKVGVAIIVLVAVAAPFYFDSDVVGLLARAFAAAIGAIGLNIVTGYAGQVSLGHAFFLGIGAYTASALSGDPEGRTIGFGVTNIVVWLLAAGLVSAIFGVLVAPLATRLRGLYLAIVTLGLVFVGEHVFREARVISGGSGVGRRAAAPELFGFRFDQGGEVLGIMLRREQRMYFLGLVLLLLLGFLAKNLVRSGIGRAFAAIRDRDIAAEAMGVPLGRYKAIAFGISSFYAGIAGAMIASVLAHIEPGSYNLLMSVRFIAMILIGGLATISGSIMGAMFVVLLPRFVQDLGPYIPLVGRGGLLTAFQLEQILYGLFIILFVLVEPRGLYGLWVRVRNYFKAWPFSY
jgi:branched-chain amino acid transport system permease protein